MVTVIDANANAMVDEGDLQRRDETTSKRFQAKARYDRFFTPNNSGYGSLQALTDEPAGKDLVAGGQVGYSRQLFKNERHRAVAELGYDLSIERAVAAGAELVQVHSARVFAAEELKLSEATGLFVNVEALFNLNEEKAPAPGYGSIAALDDKRVNARTGLTTQLWKNLAFGFSFGVRYDQAPAPPESARRRDLRPRLPTPRPHLGHQHRGQRGDHVLLRFRQSAPPAGQTPVGGASGQTTAYLSFLSSFLDFSDLSVVLSDVFQILGIILAWPLVSSVLVSCPSLLVSIFPNIVLGTIGVLVRAERAVVVAVTGLDLRGGELGLLGVQIGVLIGPLIVLLAGHSLMAGGHLLRRHLAVLVRIHGLEHLANASNVFIRADLLIAVDVHRLDLVINERAPVFAFATGQSFGRQSDAGDRQTTQDHQIPVAHVHRASPFKGDEAEPGKRSACTRVSRAQGASAGYRTNMEPTPCSMAFVAR